MSNTYYENQVIQICSEYAGIAHIGQFRKDGVTPYITHPARVACLVAYFMRHSAKWYIYVAAAWLHDVMEDCSEIIDGEYSYRINNHEIKDSLLHKFLTMNKTITPDDGTMIFDLAELLTMSQDKSITKKDRQKDYYEGMRKAGPEVSVIKYCDRIDNLSTAHIFSKGGFKWYLKETQEMMNTLGLVNYTSLYPTHWMLAGQLEGAKQKYKEMYK
jgi:(p)ppGpp synthase/HD superfamily hydrolase